MEHNAAAQEVSHLISCHLIFFSVHCSEIPSGPPVQAKEDQK